MKKIVRESLNEQRDLWEAELNLDRLVGDYIINRALIGTKDIYNGKEIIEASFLDVQSKDICSPLCIKYEDGTDQDYYGFDVLKILDDNGIRY